MPKPQIIGIFPHRPQDVSDRPLSMVCSDVPEQFLNEEISFGETIGENFYMSDLRNMWCDIAFVRALLDHPEAILPLKNLAKRYSINVEPVFIRQFFSLLDVTTHYLRSNQVDTIEDLVTKIAYHEAEMPDEFIQNDLDNAFRSVYGVSLVQIA